MRSFRHFGVWLGTLAVLMQLLLPQVHAAAYADRSGDPLGYALCGAGVTPSLAAELRQILPAEVVAALDADHAAPELTDCHACVGAHASAAVQSPAAATRAPETLVIVATPTDAAIADSRRARRPPARAPPLST